MKGKNLWKKTGFGILFVAACFASMYILMVFHGDVLMVSVAAVLLLITAFLFLNEVFSDKTPKRVPQEGELKEVLSSDTDGDFHLKVSKHMKEMENSQKELIDVLKQQNTLFQTQIENLEHEIYMLSEKQVNQSKSIIKFNKENARQLAISERETLEYVMMELKKTIEDNAGAVGVKAVAEAEPVMEETFFAETEPEAAPAIALEEVSEAELFEVSDLPDDEEFVIPDFPAPEEIPDKVEEPMVEEPAAVAEPEETDEFDLSALFEDIAEGVAAEEEQASVIAEEPAPVAEEEPAPEAAPAEDVLAGLGGDPNAMMTPEDIAKLLAAMGQ